MSQQLPHLTSTQRCLPGGGGYSAGSRVCLHSGLRATAINKQGKEKDENVAQDPHCHQQTDRELRSNSLLYSIIYVWHVI